MPARNLRRDSSKRRAALRQRSIPSLRAFSAVGYHEAFDFLDGKLTFEEAIERDITRNNQFARRQRTWFKAEPDINWLDATSASLDRDALRIAQSSL